VAARGPRAVFALALPRAQDQPKSASVGELDVLTAPE
jgi:hypothetical protein